MLKAGKCFDRLPSRMRNPTSYPPSKDVTSIYFKTYSWLNLIQLQGEHGMYESSCVLLQPIRISWVPSGECWDRCNRCNTEAVHSGARYDTPARYSP